MRNNFHLKFKEWKDRKKYFQKSIKGYFSKVKNSPPPSSAIQKRLFRKNIAEEQKQKEMEEKNKKSVDAKLR